MYDIFTWWCSLFTVRTLIVALILQTHNWKRRPKKRNQIQLSRWSPEFPTSVSWCGEPICGGFAAPGDWSIWVTSWETCRSPKADSATHLLLHLKNSTTKEFPHMVTPNPANVATSTDNTACTWNYRSTQAQEMPIVRVEQFCNLLGTEPTILKTKATSICVCSFKWFKSKQSPQGTEKVKEDIYRAYE